MGDLINQLFKDAFKNEAGVKVVRNAGLMIGIELDRPCSELVKMALEAHMLINVTAEKVVRLLPPLVISEHEARELVSRLAPLIVQFLHTQPLTKAA